MTDSRPSAGLAYNCPVEVPVKVLGGKWKLIILYHLLTGPQRNGELLRLVPGITQKMLSQQLRDLEHDGLVTRTVHEQVPPKVVYTLDPDEAERLRPLLKALCDWAAYWASQTGSAIRFAAAVR
jgi:DNA-binding HxlR family transcriptional regulator